MKTSINRKSIIKTGLLGIYICIGVYIANGQNINSPNKTGPMGLQVNTQTGNLFFSRTDVAIPSRGIGLTIGFSYNGFNFAQSSPFGNGWSLGYHIQYLNDAENNKTILWGDGREDIYKSNGKGYTQPNGFFTKLQEYEPGKLLLGEKDGTKFYFENAAHKRITKITEPNGNQLNFTYADTLLTAISTSAGQQLNLAYNSNGKLNTLTDANATPTRTWFYFYDNAGNLTRVSDPLNNEYRYSYLVNGPMKEVRDRNANVVNIIYFSDYSVSELIGCNQRISFAYDDASFATVVTDHLDNGEDQVTKYYYKKREENVWLSGIEGNCCGFKMNFEYDNAGNKIKETDANGNITRYTYDVNGNMLTITDALNQVYNFTYSSDFNFVKTTTDPKGFTSEMTYDNRGNLLQIKEPGNRIYAATYSANGDILTSTDPKGNVYTYTYDAFGNPATVSGPNGYTATLAFDSRGQLLSTTDSKGNQTSVEYDILSRLKKITDPLNQNTSMEYDANGNALQVTNPNNEAFKFSYDASNRPMVLTDPMNQSNSIQFDAQSNITMVRNVLGQTIQLTYDKQNRLKTATNNIGETVTADYDYNGNIIQLKLPNGHHLQYLYDALDRMTTMSDEHGVIAELTYDANGNVISMKNGTGAITNAAYDNLNRIIQITDPLGNSTALTYDANNRIISITDRNGNTMFYTYDGLNRVATTTDNMGATITIGYDSESNMTSLTDQNGNTTNYQYDALNRVTKTTFADGKFTEYIYNNKNLITQARLTDGSIIQYSYDVLNRMTAKTLPDGRVFSYSYDGLGRALTATNNAGTISFGYDNLNRVISETFDGRTVAYAYNTEGRTATTTYPDGKEVLMEYDSRNRMKRVLENGMELAAYTYNNNNQLVTRNLANGVSTQYQYDIAGRLTGYNSANGSIQQVQIGYDKVGNKTSILRPNNPARSEFFTYDNNYRLTQYRRGPQGNPNLQHTYAYDALGNRLSANIGGIVTNYGANNLNQLTQKTTDGTTTNLLYDDNGNLRFDGKFYKRYDAEKKLLTDSVSPSQVYAYQYDAFGRRIGKTISGQNIQYTFSGIVPIEERIGGTVRTKQIYTGLLAPLTIEHTNQKHFYLQNESGSVEAITNANGRVMERYEYDPYGKQQRFDSLGNTINASLVGNRVGFTGQEYDSATSGNSFYFRNYSPELGVFQQRDLIGYGDGMGLYQYVHNNPANGIDVLGLEDCNEKQKTTRDIVETYGSNTAGGITIVDIVINNRMKESFKLVQEVDNLNDEIATLKNVFNSFYNAKERATALKVLGESSKLNIIKKGLEGTKNFKHGKMALSGLKGLSKVGGGLGYADAAIKAEKFLETVFNPGEGYEGDAAFNKAGGELALSVGSLVPPIAAVVGTFNFGDWAQQQVTGKSMTEWSEEYGNVFGETSVDQSMDEELQEFHRKNGTLKKYLETKKRIEMREARKRRSGCPQNSNNGGTRKPSPYPRDAQSGEVLILGAYDPNEIIGPVGQPDKRWVSVKDRLPYTINCENDTSASAPAKSIRITAPIHPNMDASTLELGSFGFNSLSFSIPAGTSAYYQRLDCRDSLSIFVDITAGYDVVNNQIFWLLQSIDPLTLQAPTDPLIGLLLLQDTANLTYGHGFANFSIKPRATAITLDSILAEAEIIFDNNEPIGTNIERNTIDAFAPTSKLNALPPTSPMAIQLSWSGQDDKYGCGIRFYTLYVSEDGVNYNILRSKITRTDTVITGQAGKHYYFFVLATDSVGNTEQLKQGSIQNTFVGEPLPATWLYFTGVNNGADNLLRWATANERDIKEYVLERSPDANNFKPLGKQKPNGGLARQGNYQYLDEKVDKLKTDALFYRIKQVDSDGSHNYSSIIKIAVRREILTRTIVYPNPTKGNLTLAVGNGKLIGSDASIYDIKGRVVQQIKIISDTQTINLSELANGIYIIKLKNGEILRVLKQ